MKTIIFLALLAITPFSNASFCDSYSELAEIVMEYRQSGSDEIINISRPQGSDLDDLIYAAYNWNVMDNKMGRDIAVAEFKHVMNNKCIKCVDDIERLKKIEREFSSKIAIIGVYSDLEERKNRKKLLRKFILRNDIDFAVIDDNGSKLKKEFGINSFPKYVLLDLGGEVDLISDEVFKVSKIRKIIRKNSHNVNAGFLPISLERNAIVKNVLSFPSKIEYAKEIRHKLYRGKAFLVSNSGAGNIMIFKEDGKVITQLGSKNSGYSDQNVKRSKFKSPSGMAFYKNKLYVADSLNNVIRKVDFGDDKVSTLIGSSTKGDVLSGSSLASDVDLSYPTDVVFFPDRNHLIIANSGSNQLLQYNFKTKKVKVIAGNGSLGMKDGFYPKNSLAMTNDMSVYNGKLYFVDNRSGSLRVMDKKYRIKTLIGKGVGKFGYKNGSKKDALMGESLGVFANRNGVYISDAKNHKLRKYQYSNHKIKAIFGSDLGDTLGEREKTRFEEPEGSIIVKNAMFVVDSGNNRVVKIAFKDMKSSLVDVIPKMKLPHEGFLEYLPNLERLEKAKVKMGTKIPLNISFDKGWKLNEYGPSFLNLLEIVGEKSADLVATYDWNMIKNNVAFLPKLKKGKKYIIQGTIYYCQDKRNALCYISSYEQELSPSKDGKKVLNIEI